METLGTDTRRSGDRVYVVMALAGDFEDLQDRAVAGYFDRELAEEHRARAEAHLEQEHERHRAWEARPDGSPFEMAPSPYDPELGEGWTAYWVFEAPLRDALPA